MDTGVPCEIIRIKIQQTKVQTGNWRTHSLFHTRSTKSSTDKLT